MMRKGGTAGFLLATCLTIGIAVLPSAPAFAHCDGMDGPVVKAAQEALAERDVNLVLIWVQKNDEEEIRRAFERALNVRELTPEAKELADTYFFETLVRLHRAGEGAPFTGLKPAGRDLGPAIPAADQALKSGNVAPLANLLAGQMRTGVVEQYEQVMAVKDFNTQDIQAGREYVKRYVAFVHYVEGIYGAATGRGESHAPDGEESFHHE